MTASVYTTDAEWKAAHDEFVADFGDLLDRHQRLLDSPRPHADDCTCGEDGWEPEFLQALASTPVTGWVLVIERHDPTTVDGYGSFNTYYRPDMQAPTHTLGMLSNALDQAR